MDPATGCRPRSASRAASRRPSARRLRHRTLLELAQVGRAASATARRVPEQIALDQHVRDVARDVVAHAGAHEERPREFRERPRAVARPGILGVRVIDSPRGGVEVETFPRAAPDDPGVGAVEQHVDALRGEPVDLRRFIAVVPIALPARRTMRSSA